MGRAMESGQFDHKLVAILYADAAGYSRLTGEDEVGTHRTLSAFLDLFTESIQQHGGKVVHYAGDAILAEFQSVLRALTCGISVQEDLKRRNDGLPEERQVRFRIGVNLGEVIVDRGDIYGEGVNVAARLETLGEPGGICISEAVRTALGTKLPLEFESLGEQSVKNIKEPVRAYHVRLKPDAVLPTPSPEARPRSSSRYAIGAAVMAVLIIGGGMLAWQIPWKSEDETELVKRTVSESQSEHSIAVLPFANVSGDPEQDYFVDGMTVDLITDLSKVSGLFVIGRSSVFEYKGITVKPSEVREALNVRYVLEGSVRKGGEQLRITAHLIDTTTGLQLWAQRFDRSLSDVFALQDEITAKIISALAVELTESERESIVRKYTDNVQAYDHFLRGLDHYGRRTKEDNLTAREFFAKATEVDPNFARAYAGAALTHAREALSGWSDSLERSLGRGDVLARKALALDESLPQGHFAQASLHYYAKEHDKALTEIEKAVTLDPNYADAYVLLAEILVLTGRPRDGLKVMEKALRLNPREPASYAAVPGMAYFTLGRYEDAIATLDRGLKLNPTHQRMRMWLAASYALVGRQDDADWEANEVLTLDPEFSLERIRDAIPYKDPAHLDRLLEGLRKAGLR